MEKLSAGSSDFMVGNQSILIDLSSWYKASLAPKIELIRTAIDNGRELEFTYYSPKGEAVRCIELYYLIFRWPSWYVWGWCKKREDLENLITWLMSFRDKVELLEPEEVRAKIRESIENMKRKYDE